MFYSWKLNFVLSLSHFLVNISTDQCSNWQIVSMLFSQRRSNADEHPLIQLSFSTKFQRWNNIGSSTLNWRNSFNVVSTLFCQHLSNFDKHTSAQLSISTKFQPWNNIDERWRCVCWVCISKKYLIKYQFQQNLSRKINIYNVSLDTISRGFFPPLEKMSWLVLKSRSSSNFHPVARG